MANNKHLTLGDRSIIETMIKGNNSFKAIGEALDKDPTTISKEIRLHFTTKKSGSKFRIHNACVFRFTCEKNRICITCNSNRKYKLCKSCPACNMLCKDFSKETCDRLMKPPYVCNPCARQFNCTLEKQFYDAVVADKHYHLVLAESRTGISLSEEEMKHLDGIISPLVMKQQSPHHIYVNNKDSIMISERTMYRLIDARLLVARNIDLPRKVRFSARRKAASVKVDKACRIGRDYECFTVFLTDNPDTPVTELDTLEGKKGGKVLLTVHFVKAEFMLAFLRDHNDSQSVIDIFDRLYLELRPDRFTDIFELCLTDNGSEFSNPNAIEFDKQGNRRTRLYYCDPSSPFQKGSAERNHQFIRCFFPKGRDISGYSQPDISLMMDHINSYGRKTLSDKCPYDMFSFLYGKEVLDLLGCNKIHPNDVTLNRSVFRKEAEHEV